MGAGPAEPGEQLLPPLPVPRPPLLPGGQQQVGRGGGVEGGAAGRGDGQQPTPALAL